MKQSNWLGAYTTDVPEIASQLFDGELVIANYKSGLYYSISIDGSWIWQALTAGLTVSQVTNWMSGHFKAQSEDIANLVPAFVDKLVIEGLILQTSKSENTSSDLPIFNKPNFDPPVIERFDDLQELLLLDPVHDVDQTGWPRRPTTNE